MNATATVPKRPNRSILNLLVNTGVDQRLMQPVLTMVIVGWRVVDRGGIDPAISVAAT